MPDADRQYTEDEVRELLARAVERQEADRRHAHTAHGLTLEEVERIAAEVGIDPRYVAAAAEDLERTASLAGINPYLGGPLRIERERTVEGRLTEADVAPLVEALRTAYNPKDRGRVETLAGTVEWSGKADDSGDRLFFKVEPRGNHTQITLRHAMDSTAVLLHLWPPMLLVFGLIPLVAPDGSLTLTAVMTAVAAALYGLAWISYRALARKREQKLRGMMDRLEAMAAEAARPDRLAAPEPAGRLDLESLDEHPPEAAPPRRERTRGMGRES